MPKHNPNVTPDTPVYIYGLIDPRTSAVRYIGQTYLTLNSRLRYHLSDALRGQRNYRCNWIRSMLAEGVTPIIRVIAETTYDERVTAERYWISYYGRENLTNSTDGGEGTAGYIYTDEVKKKLSDAHLGQVAWNKGISTDTSHLKRFQFKKGRVPENKGVSLSPETKDKISKSKRGVQIGKTKKSSSKYVGVTYNNQDSVWISTIKYEKNTFIGRYSTEESAGIAYDMASLWYSDDRSYLNFPKRRDDYINILNSNDIENLKMLRKAIKVYIGG